MKITRIEIIPIDQPHKGRLIFSTGPTRSSNNFILMKIYTDEGVVGVGSSSMWPDSPLLKQGASREGAMVLMKDMSKLLIGEDPCRVNYLLTKLENSMSDWFSENWYVLATFDCALYDLKGKVLGLPVYELLGGIQREKIALEHIQSYLPTPEEAAEEAKRYIDAGFKSIKLHVNFDPKQAVARFKAARKALGADIPMGVDMGAAYNLYGALHTIEMLDEYDLNFAEQPLHMYDFDNQILLRQKTRVPIVADHGAMSVKEAFACVKAGAYDSCHCLLARIGGAYLATKWADLMDLSFTDYQICNMSNSIAAAIGAHFAVTRKKTGRFNDELGLYLYLHDTTDTKSITDDIVCEQGFVIEDGYLHSPKGPGLGVVLNEEMVKRYTCTSLHTIVVE